jgi:hypothetical protein
MMRVLSLGAGVQSTTLLLMSLDGTLPKLDYAIFADTGWEPRRVYDHLDRITEVAAGGGVPVLRVSKGNLRRDITDPAHRYASIPYFVRNPDGSEGMGRRQCTSEYKLSPIRRKVRELLGAPEPGFRRVPRGRVAEQWVGFSVDEIGRVSDKFSVLYMATRYPLLDLSMDRKACERWLRTRGWTSVAKSACIGCPMHGNRQWRELRDTCLCGHHRSHHAEPHNGAGVLLCGDCQCIDFETPEWDEAVVLDAAIREGGSHRLPSGGEAFLHRSLVPLSIAPIDRVTSAEWKSRQGDLLDVIADEEGDPDGCSPYGCRSGSAVGND